LPILEAMACRTPVIGTPAGAAPDLLCDGGGLLVRPEDPRDMARAIVQVHAMDEPAWMSMSDAAYEVASRFTWDHATDLFEAALHRAIAKANRTELTAA
jgi:glycosyltransferase involved in cell wall biosynthesis